MIKITLAACMLYCFSTITLNAWYAEYPSWAFYFWSRHTNYKNYQPPVDISQNGCQWGSWVTFAQKIEAIQIKVRNAFNPVSLFYSKDFLAMYKHPLYYKQAILGYLADKAYTLEQKAIAIYAASHTDLYKSAYQLYKNKKLDLETLSLIFAINLGNILPCNSYPESLKYALNKGIIQFLKQIMPQLPKESELYKDLETLLTLKFPKRWKPYAISEKKLSNRDTLTLSYYQDILPFYDVILNAVKDKKYFDCWRGPTMQEGPVGVENPPYFLMVLEHPKYYYTNHLKPGSDMDADGKLRRNGVSILKDPKYLEAEKSLTIFGMSQLGLLDPCESAEHYALIIDQACNWYQQGALTDKHLYQLLVCDVRAFYKYPFFILDYKDENVQRALDKLINLPTIPCGLREIAQKVKAGTLATKEEMEYMEGYRTFRKTYFTLYETIPPST